MLLPRIVDFFQKHCSSDDGVFPAIDDGSGTYIYTVTITLNLHATSKNGDLIWYPTDWTGVNDG